MRRDGQRNKGQEILDSVNRLAALLEDFRSSLEAYQNKIRRLLLNEPN